MQETVKSLLSTTAISYLFFETRLKVSASTPMSEGHPSGGACGEKKRENIIESEGLTCYHGCFECNTERIAERQQPKFVSKSFLLYFCVMEQ